MTIARTAVVLVGTNESTGASTANNASSTSSETDLWSDDLSEGWVWLYQKFTSTVTAGSIDSKLTKSRVAANGYTANAPVVSSNAPINGTQNIDPAQVSVDRLATLTMTNNATGATATNVLGALNSTKES